jgi:hypothetical protein
VRQWVLLVLDFSTVNIEPSGKTGFCWMLGFSSVNSVLVINEQEGTSVDKDDSDVELAEKWLMEAMCGGLVDFNQQRIFCSSLGCCMEGLSTVEGVRVD